MCTFESYNVERHQFPTKNSLFPSFSFHRGSLMDGAHTYAHTRTSSHLIWPNAFLMQLVLLKLLISWISSLWISPFTELSQLLDKPLQSTAIYKWMGHHANQTEHILFLLFHIFGEKEGGKTQFVFAQTINKHRSDQMRHSEPEERSERKGRER